MLTKRQGKILDIIINYIEEEGISPTVREIGELAHLTSSATVLGYLDRLEKQGYIERRVDTPRSIKVIKVLNGEIKFGDRVKKLRENAKMTQAELGKNIGVSDRVLGYYESNERFPRNPETLIKLADTFQISVDELLREPKEAREEEDLPKVYEGITHKVARQSLKALEEFFKEEGVSLKQKEDILGCVAYFFLNRRKQEIERKGKIRVN